MPCYDYRCPACGSLKIDVIHKMTEEPEILCDKCQAKMRIQVEATNFLLKGIGWGKDGYTKHSTKKIMDYKKGKKR